MNNTNSLGFTVDEERVEERRRSAYHEAGHAVARVALGLPVLAVDIEAVDVEGVDRRSGRTWSGEELDLATSTLDGCTREAVACAAGPAAEARYRGLARGLLCVAFRFEDGGPTRDDALLADLADRRARLCGPSGGDGDGGAARWKEEWFADAERLLDGVWGAIERVAASLLERGRIEREQLLTLARTA